VTKLEMFLTVGKTFLVPMKTGLIKDRPLEWQFKTDCTTTMCWHIHKESGSQWLVCMTGKTILRPLPCIASHSTNYVIKSNKQSIC
jgi:hypothetical protein